MTLLGVMAPDYPQQFFEGPAYYRPVRAPRSIAGNFDPQVGGLHAHQSPPALGPGEGQQAAIRRPGVGQARAPAVQRLHLPGDLIDTRRD